MTAVRRVRAVMSSAWIDRARPPRSTRVMTGILIFGRPPRGRCPASFGGEVPVVAALGSFPLAVVSLVNLHDLPCSAERRQHVIPHRLANAMADEPAGFEIDPEDAAELICGEAFLAAANQMHRLKPNVQRHMALFEDGADLHGKRFAAGIALVGAEPSAFAFQRAGAVDDTAMRAN